MAETEQEKTEAPSQRRRDDAADEGRVPRSAEVNAAALLLASAVAFSAAGPALAASLRDVVGAGLGFGGAGQLTSAGAVELIRALGWKAMAGSAGFLAALALTALVIGAAQARGTFTFQPLTPKFSRLNPAENAKRVVGTQGFIELGKSLVKLVVVGWAVRGVLEAAWPDVVALGQESPRALLEVARTHGIKLFVHAGTAYLALAGADYGWQLWRHEQSLRMTKEEVKQESKQQDGDPMVKQRMRALARQRARRQMMKDVPKADVVVVNPVHIAVALRYDPDVAPAPYVVALGRRKVAERIKEIAFASGVPVVENIPLARALIAGVQLGSLIPAELYVAVAEVLAFVLRRRGGAPAQSAVNAAA
ncbi:MAG TPA: EscU/YscU/HrcU family type III secretion system export apparatus switch protein [Gemmatirosa sp.]